MVNLSKSNAKLLSCPFFVIVKDVRDEISFTVISETTLSIVRAVQAIDSKELYYH